VAKKKLPRPSGPCFSARTVSPCLSDPMELVRVLLGSYVEWFRGSCRRRAVFDSRQAAPISVPSSTGCSLGNMATCWVGGSELASPSVWMGSSASFVLSAISGLKSLRASAGDPRRRSRRLSFPLPPGCFLSLLVRPRIKSRTVGGGLGSPFL